MLIISKVSSIFAVTRRYISNFWWNLTLPGLLRARGVTLENNVQILGMPIVSFAKNTKICVEAGAVLCSKSEYTALGVSRPVILRTLRSGAIINIGRNSGLSGTTICAAQSVTIGDDCLIGADTLICDTDFHPVSPFNRRYNNLAEEISAKPICIERNVFIGARSIILKGVTIGENTVIGAGSVVTSSIPPNVIAVGNPAKISRQLE